jgi:hypothetical protein
LADGSTAVPKVASILVGDALATAEHTATRISAMHEALSTDLNRFI